MSRALLLCVMAAQVASAHWRGATAAELDAAIPNRAPVVNERVETERASMSGITDQDGHSIAAAVLITAGYSAAGKYSDFLSTQLPLVVGGVHLPAGRYLVGWTRGDSGLDVQLYQAMDGKLVAKTTAAADPSVHRVEQIRVWAPSPEGKLQLGRFVLPFRIDSGAK